MGRRFDHADRFGPWNTPALNYVQRSGLRYTSWNVPVSDHDRLVRRCYVRRPNVKVNAKAMPTLASRYLIRRFQAIPYVINRNDASDQYGNAERNATEKRVFAVGRSDVQSWGGSGVIETLTLTDARHRRPRNDGRAACRFLDRYRMARAVVLRPAAQTWDGAGSGTTSAQVQMLLTSTYLVKVAGNSNVAMTPPSFSGPTASSGSMSDERNAATYSYCHVW